MLSITTWVITYPYLIVVTWRKPSLSPNSLSYNKYAYFDYIFVISKQLESKEVCNNAIKIATSQVAYGIAKFSFHQLNALLWDI